MTTRQRILKRFFIVIAIAIVTVLYSLPSGSLGDNALTRFFGLDDADITLGLDLAGGTELDYEIDMSETDALIAAGEPISREQIAENVRDALEKRVNPAGVGEVLVKRSQINEEEHVLVQLPPSSNVEKAKRDAEQDNRLVFFEENPAKEVTARLTAADILGSMTPSNWNTRVEQVLQDQPYTSREVFEDVDLDSMVDRAFAERLRTTPQRRLVDTVIETQTEANYTFGEDGNVNITSLPKSVLGIVYVTNKSVETVEQAGEPTANASHILISYPGAERASEDVPYENKEEAQIKAQEILQGLIQNGTDNFAELAQEFSNGPSATNGGDLGQFTPDKMVQEFSDAIFGDEKVTAPGLIEEVIETEFGFHIINVTALNKNPEVTQTEKQRVSYEILAWDKNQIAWEETDLGGAQLNIATVGYNEVGQPFVALAFDNEGGDMFGDITKRVSERSCNSGAHGGGPRPCMIGAQVGGTWVSQATVREPILGGSAIITGNFTFDESRDLADRLNLGAIDAPVRLSGQITVKPELGADQLSRSLKAGMWGLLATIFFMILMYRFAGLLAGISLGLYSTIFVTILKLWPESFGGPIVLSLAGFAGLALSIGLAVDGNILIFERMKEELKGGKSLSKAIELGFERAWSAIKDSNMTTLIICAILASIGSSVVKGFAITLTVGTVLSMFTAVWVSYGLLRASQLIKALQNSVFFIGKKSKN